MLVNCVHCFVFVNDAFTPVSIMEEGQRDVGEARKIRISEQKEVWELVGVCGRGSMENCIGFGIGCDDTQYQVNVLSDVPQRRTHSAYGMH